MKRFSLLFIGMLLIFSSCVKPKRVVEEFYTPEQPKLVAYYTTEDGVKVKVEEEKYYENGKLEYKGGYDKDKRRNGRWEYYFNNGKLWSIGEYEYGKMEGKKEVYWPDGQIRYKGQFSNNKKSGHWVFYNADGSVLKEMDVEPNRDLK